MDYCYGCHSQGTKKGGVAFDGEGSEATLVKNRQLWWAVLKNVRAGTMPPSDKPHPNPKELKILADWIKRDVFGSNPQEPDPGRVTIRRLNRVEYHNTIRDLMGIEFKAEEEFPPDDTGYGFDNIGDVLTVSPLLLEKYFQAAETIVKTAVPTVPKLMPERSYRGAEFRGEERGVNGDRLAFSRASKVSRTFGADHPGDYRLTLEVAVQGGAKPDPGRYAVVFKMDDRVLMKESFGRYPSKTFYYTFNEKLLGGDHRMTFEVRPQGVDGARSQQPEVDYSQVLPGAVAGGAFVAWRTRGREPAVSLGFRVISLKIAGPMDPEYWTRRPATRDSSPETNRPPRTRSVANMLGRSWHASPGRPSVARPTTGPSTV